MNHLALKLENIFQNETPFVCKKLPFVCINYPLVSTSVCERLPSVWNRQFGFTLVELIITLTIIGILAAVAVPGLQSFILDGRLTAQANDALSDLSFARSEAIRRGTRVTLCKTLDPTASSTSCDTAAYSHWTTGRIIFVDEGTAGTIDTSDTILRFKDALEGASSSNNRLLGDSTAGTPVRISYLSNGQVEGFTTGETQLRLCDSRGVPFGRAIVITNTGRVRVSPRGQAKSGALSCS